MNDSPSFDLGNIRQVAVWAMYFVEDAQVDGVNMGPVPVVIWMLASDECLCGRCWPASDATCLELARVARVQLRRERERHADRDIQLDRFELPAYLSVTGRLREIAQRVAARGQADDDMNDAT